MEAAVSESDSLKGERSLVSQKTGPMAILAAVAVLVVACASETPDAPISRAMAIERAAEQVASGNSGPEPAEPRHAVARLMPWSVFDRWSESAPARWTGQGYGEPDPDDPVWVVQMETGQLDRIPGEAGSHVFPIVVLDAVTGLQEYGVWSTDPFTLPPDYFDPEERLGAVHYVVEPSRISHKEAIDFILERGRDLSPVTPLRGRPDLGRATADLVRYLPDARLGWLLTLPYEPGYHQQAGAALSSGGQPPRPIEWTNVLFAILDDDTGSLIGAGTDRSVGPAITNAQSAALFGIGRDSGWWRLWDILRSVSIWELVPERSVVDDN